MPLELQKLFARHQLSLRGVVHVGAHYGQEVPLYTKMGAREIALFEPLTENIEILAKNVALWQRQKGSPRFDLFQLALGSSHIENKMIISSNQGMSSSLLKPKEHLQRHPQVKFERGETVCVTRMDRIITQPDRYNLLCIDVQGYELEVLKGAGASILSHMDAILCEVNRSEVYEGNSLVHEIDAYLKGFGFQRVETVWTGGIWGDAFYLNQRHNAKKDPDARVIALQQKRLEELYTRLSIDPGMALGKRLIPSVQMHDCCKLLSHHPALPSKSEVFPDALRLIRMGRYSNNIIQVLHAALIAKSMGIKRIILPAGFAHLHGANAMADDLHFVQDGMPSTDKGLQLASYCWFPKGSLRSHFHAITTQQARQAANKIVKPLFFQHFPFLDTSIKVMEPKTRTLVAHLRSGDLFKNPNEANRLPHPTYVQPPLSFYQLAIEHSLSAKDGPNKVKMVIEDRKNPVINALIEWLQRKRISFSIINGDFQEAIETMLCAQTIVSAYGSVIEMIGMLSDNLQSVYAFQGYGRWAEKDFGGHGRYELLGSFDTLYKLELEGDYIEMGNWKDTEKQRKSMLSYKASAAALQEETMTPNGDAEQPFFIL